MYMFVYDTDRERVFDSLPTVPCFVRVKEAYDRVVGSLVETYRRGESTYGQTMEMIERLKTGLYEEGYVHAVRMELIEFQPGRCCFCGGGETDRSCCRQCANHHGIFE